MLRTWYCKRISKKIKASNIALPSKIGWVCDCGMWYDGEYEYIIDTEKYSEGELCYKKKKPQYHNKA